MPKPPWEPQPLLDDDARLWCASQFKSLLNQNYRERTIAGRTCEVPGGRMIELYFRETYREEPQLECLAYVKAGGKTLDSETILLRRLLLKLPVLQGLATLIDGAILVPLR